MSDSKKNQFADKSIYKENDNICDFSFENN